MSGLPPGFELDRAPAAQGGLPEGFTLDEAPKQSPMQQMLTDFSNQGAAASQRTTPNVTAQSKNLISDNVQENDAGDAMYVDPQTGKLAPTDRARHVILRDPQDGRLKVFGRTENTNEGILSAAGRLLGTGMATGPVAVTKAAAPAVTAAERIGVDVPRAIATDSPLVAFTGQVAARAPGGGPMLKAIEESRNSLSSAVGRAAEMAGGVRDPAMAGDNFAAAIDNSFKPMVKSGVSAAYDNVASLMDRSVKTPLESTQSAVGDILARRGESAIQGLGKAVDTVSEGIKREGGMTFEGIKGLRTHIGEMLDSGVFPEGMSEHELRRLYGALSDDMQNAAFASGGSRAVAALERANDLTKQVAEWKDGIKKVLGPSSRSGEGVTEAIIRMASSGASGDAETLAKARSAVPKEVWQDIASTAINRLGKARNGEWTPAAYATDFRNMSDRGRALLFRSVGSGDVLPFLKDIAEVSQKFVDRGKLANTSGTAGHNALYATGGAVLTGAMHGSWVEPLTAIAGIAGVNGISRVLAKPASAASVAKWSRVYSTFVATQSPASRAALDIATRNLVTNAATQGVQIAPGTLLRSVSGVNADEQPKDVPRPRAE